MINGKRRWLSALGILLLLTVLFVMRYGGGVVPAGSKKTSGRQDGSAVSEKSRKPRPTQPPARRLPGAKAGDAASSGATAATAGTGGSSPSPDARSAPMVPAEWMKPGIPMKTRLAMIPDDHANLFKFFTLQDVVDSTREALQRETYPQKQITDYIRIGSAFLEMGRTTEGLKELKTAQEILTKNNLPVDSTIAQQLKWWLAIGSIRLGEQDNCVNDHSADSCVFPIHGSGVYRQTRGPRDAIKYYNAYLAYDQENLGARWLLNLAYQTVGEWPDKVPKKYLIPPEAFKSDYDIGHFTDVAPAVGLDHLNVSGGAILEDFDRDGFQDVMISGLGLKDQLRYYRNNGDATFTDETEAAGLMGEWGGLNMMQTDYNNDGRPDVYITRGAWMGRYGRHPNSLLRNDGPDKSGHIMFTDVTEEAGLLAFYPTQTASWADYDNDGWLDLYVGAESVGPDVFPCELYHNNGDGTFTELASKVGIQYSGYVKGVVWGDYDNDGLPDLFISQLRANNVLFHNDGPDAASPGGWKFTDVSKQAGIGPPVYSFPAFWFDYDNDGWEDLFVAPRTGDTPDTGKANEDPLAMIAADYLGLPHSMESPALYHNNHDGTFTDVAKQMHLDKALYGMGMNFGDLDNDGWLDFYVGTGNPNLHSLMPNRMFRNDEGKSFQDVTTSGGFGHLQKGHGIAFGDIDNDGDQDIFEELGAAWPGDVANDVLFLNPGHGNHFVTLRVRGTRSNRAAIGTRIKVTVATPSGDRDIHLTVGSGGSFGASTMQSEIGLGAATAIRRVELFWPKTRKTQVVTGLELDHVYNIQEGAVTASPVTTKQVPLNPEMVKGIHHHHMMPGTEMPMPGGN